MEGEPHEIPNPQMMRSASLEGLSSSFNRSFLAINSKIRGVKESQGKEMRELITSRKKIESRIQTVQNRINHINNELQNSQRALKIQGKKEEKLRLIKDTHTNYKNDILSKVKQIEEEKRQREEVIRKNRVDTKAKIRTAQEATKAKNKHSRDSVKEQEEAMRKKLKERIEEMSRKRKEKVLKACESNRNIHRTRTASFETKQASLEVKHLARVKAEENKKKQAAQMLEELEAHEAKLIETLTDSSQLSPQKIVKLSPKKLTQK